jgi:hypothetical protein
VAVAWYLPGRSDASPIEHDPVPPEPPGVSVALQTEVPATLTRAVSPLKGSGSPPPVVTVTEKVVADSFPYASLAGLATSVVVVESVNALMSG